MADCVLRNPQDCGTGGARHQRLYLRVLSEAIRRLDTFCRKDLQSPERFLLALDEHAQRNELLTAAARDMYGGKEPRRQLIEPPFLSFIDEPRHTAASSTAPADNNAAASDDLHVLDQHGPLHPHPARDFVPITVPERPRASLPLLLAFLPSQARNRGLKPHPTLASAAHFVRAHGARLVLVRGAHLVLVQGAHLVLEMGAC